MQHKKPGTPNQNKILSERITIERIESEWIPVRTKNQQIESYACMDTAEQNW